jgi:hypothetical protein
MTLLPFYLPYDIVTNRTDYLRDPEYSGRGYVLGMNQNCTPLYFHIGLSG